MYIFLWLKEENKTKGEKKTCTHHSFPLEEVPHITFFRISSFCPRGNTSNLFFFSPIHSCAWFYNYNPMNVFLNNLNNMLLVLPAFER